MKVLVTGGAGYIGSHTVLALLAAGHDVVVLDNLVNASPRAVAAMERLAEREVPLVRADIGDREALDAAFADAGFDAVVHFAALKAVGDSVAEPLRYYRDNVAGSLTLLDRMAAHGVRTIVFSSTAAVYGDAAESPISEDARTEPASPYGRSKLVVEKVLRDQFEADASWRISVLRYFNAVGAHPSGLLGEAPVGRPANLLPFMAEVATGKRDYLPVMGTDYATPDGTGVRDYLHVMDLARGHVRALEFLAAGPRHAIHNLGTGVGKSVLEVVDAFERACGRSIPRRLEARRSGDVAVCVADPARANAELGWRAEHDLDDCCRDLWRWCRTHPNGFE